MLSTYIRRVPSLFGKVFAFLLVPELHFLGRSYHEEVLLHYHLHLVSSRAQRTVTYIAEPLLRSAHGRGGCSPGSGL